MCKLLLFEKKNHIAVSTFYCKVFKLDRLVVRTEEIDLHINIYNLALSNSHFFFFSLFLSLCFCVCPKIAVGIEIDLCNNNTIYLGL